MRPRQALFRQRKALSLALLAALVGCSTPAGQLRQCQQEKEQLLAAIQKQRQTAEALRDKVASLEERLDQAEKELARGAASTRLSSRPQNPPLAADAASRSSASTPASDAALSWRAPPGKAPDGKSANPSSASGSPDNKESLPGSGSPARPLPPRASSEQGAATGGARPTGASRQEPYRVRPAATTTEDAPAARPGDFSASTRPASRTIHKLLASDGRCEYDPQVGACRLRVPLSFRDGATLTAESKQHLDELARWLNRPQMRDVRVLVTGYVEGRPSADENGGRPTTAREQSLARAAAVADYLDRHGIAHERLGISAVGSRGPIGQPGPSPNASGGVQIFLVEPEAPVIGWGPTGHPIRR
jgi:outer membrane protein OmpA-like peptidoglycan-associated protein